jgi:hypothetical protein
MPFLFNFLCTPLSLTLPKMCGKCNLWFHFNSELAEQAHEKEKNRREAERVEREIQGDKVDQMKDMVWVNRLGKLVHKNDVDWELRCWRKENEGKSP